MLESDSTPIPSVNSSAASIGAVKVPAASTRLKLKLIKLFLLYMLPRSLSFVFTQYFVHLISTNYLTAKQLPHFRSTAMSAKHVTLQALISLY